MKHSDKPTLLLLTSSFPSSPSDETCGYLRDFARCLSVDFDVTVLAPSHPSMVRWPPDLFTLVRSRSILPARLNPFKAGDDLNHLASSSLLAKLATLASLVCFFAHALLLAFRADVICSHWMVPSGVAGAAICRLLRKKHVVVEHSGALHFLNRIRGGIRIAKFIVNGSNQIITVSSDLKLKLIALCPEARDKVEVIPMGVTIPTVPCEANTSDRSARTILFIGRLTEIKGLDVLLKAMKGMDDLRLIVAGDGELRDELESLARALAVNAEFVGRISNRERQQLFSKCDAVVIPSRVLSDGRTEGTPVVCLEAMAAGRVVVASEVGGLAEVIVDGENGLLFKPGDDRMLAEVLSRVMTDESLRWKLAENARSSVASYDWAMIGSRYASIINSALRVNDAVNNRGIEAHSIDG